ncbi:E3 ubiquitin-protein ligase hrd1 [Polyrhizophydium stewartii]|uniref:RING-type E3 ubiquitin transferase n=1 Tax=Polyrhizophydium stewartii TaxID=2732419 RepID=A0ABR4N752_9FUNG
MVLLGLRRLTLFGLASTALSALVLLNAFVQRQGQFFGTCIHLTQSGGSLLVLCSMLLYAAVISGRTLQRLLFGELRVIEIEHIYERSWFSIMDVCLAMTIFRNEFDLRFVGLFIFLLFVKIFHWICADRVDYMDQAPNVNAAFHLRILATITGLVAIDLAFLAYSVNTIVRFGASMIVVFAFEYTILLVLVVSVLAKYILHTIDLRSEAHWDDKSMYFFYVELFSDFFKLVSYVVFFGVVIHFYGIPLHIVRDLYMTLRSFVQRCRDLVQYHRATANMQQRYPNASEQELAATDRVCIVCREEMVAAAPADPAAQQNAQGNPPARAVATHDPLAPKKLPCGHIFHFRCLRGWLERQQACPTW